MPRIKDSKTETLRATIALAEAEIKNLEKLKADIEKLENDIVQSAFMLGYAISPLKAYVVLADREETETKKEKKNGN